MAQVERDGELDLAEVTSVVSALLIGGMVTVGHFLASLLLLLLENPEQMAALRHDPALIPKAVEEGLRVAPPAMWQARRVAVDTELQGVRLPAGAVVLLVLGAANRTEQKFECPAHFDPSRPNARDHLRRPTRRVRAPAAQDHSPQRHSAPVGNAPAVAD